jgi:3-dehydroquinate dehydratase-1
MRNIRVRNVQIGDGIPKICVPIVAGQKQEILEGARNILSTSADLAEWRIDFFQEAESEAAIWDVLKELRRLLGDIPLIATLRTAKEGGELELNYAQYEKILLAVAKSGMADLIDVEAFSFGEIAEELIERIHMCGGLVIASNHEFSRILSENEMVSRLRRLQSMGADIPKLAVMPSSPMDVLALLSATYRMTSQYADRPIITMSMAGYGCVSRIAGEVFGSAVTFASAGADSAPGQMPAEAVRSTLDVIHGVLRQYV